MPPVVALFTSSGMAITEPLPPCHVAVPRSRSTVAVTRSRNTRSSERLYCHCRGPRRTGRRPAATSRDPRGGDSQSQHSTTPNTGRPQGALHSPDTALVRAKAFSGCCPLSPPSFVEFGRGPPRGEGPGLKVMPSTRVRACPVVRRTRAALSPPVVGADNGSSHYHRL